MVDLFYFYDLSILIQYNIYMNLVNDILQTMQYKGVIEINITKTNIKKNSYYSYIMHVITIRKYLRDNIITIKCCHIQKLQLETVQPLIPQYVLSTLVNYS